MKCYNFVFFLFLQIGHVTNIPTTHGMDPDTQKHHDIVSLDFLVIHFFLFLQCLSYHISKCAQIMLTLLHHCQQLSLSCLSFFLHFLAIFTSVTILGNAHRLCKQCINIIKKTLNHVYSFSPHFS